MKTGYLLFGLMVLLAVAPQAGFAQGFCLWSYCSTNGLDICNRNTGYVGVGTAAPDSKLEVVGSADQQDPVMHVEAGDGHLADVLLVDTFEDVPLWVVTKDGNVGVGEASPDSKVEVVGEADRETPLLHVVSGDGHLTDVVRVDTFEEVPLFVVDESGKTGVGVANPQQKLHVNGAMRLEPQPTPTAGASGDLCAGNDGHLYYYNGTVWKEVAFVE